ncbi:hypothetical protein J7L67_09040 [bacterium]|nr:hypothetical protein [bacterium]
MSVLKGKTILVGVTGSVAAYKACELVSRLMDCGAHAKVVMTESAMKFVTPLTFESLTGEQAVTDLWTRTALYGSTVHISLAQSVDCAIIAPATANIIGKMRCGICDDVLNCILCAIQKPVIIAPAMNEAMYKNVVVQDNIAELKKRKILFIEPEEGKLACGVSGKGRLAETKIILNFLADTLKSC